jgi:hypothetical protein
LPYLSHQGREVQMLQSRRIARNAPLFTTKAMPSS